MGKETGGEKKNTKETGIRGFGSKRLGFGVSEVATYIAPWLNGNGVVSLFQDTDTDYIKKSV
jgi:hypothetical protein